MLKRLLAVMGTYAAEMVMLPTVVGMLATG